MRAGNGLDVYECAYHHCLTILAVQSHHKSSHGVGVSAKDPCVSALKIILLLKATAYKGRMITNRAGAALYPPHVAHILR